MDNVTHNKLIKGLQSKKQSDSYSFKTSIPELLEKIPNVTGCSVPSTGGGIGVVTIWIPQTMEHRAPFNFSENHSPFWKYVLLRYSCSNKLNRFNFPWIPTWANGHSCKILHFKNSAGFKTSYRLEFLAFLKNLLKFSPLDIRSHQGKWFVGFPFSRNFWNLPALSQLIFKNLSHTFPHSNHQRLSIPNSRTRYFGKGEIFSGFKPFGAKSLEIAILHCGLFHFQGTRLVPNGLPMADI